MMAKMGWEADKGRGLGKEEQGIVNPLIVEKGKGSGHATIKEGDDHK